MSLTNDRHPREAGSSANNASQDGLPATTGEDSPSSRRLWDTSTADDAPANASPTSVDPAATGKTGSEDRPKAPEGTPTPGYHTPVGRPEAGPAVFARPLEGTTPRPTNPPPTAPAGTGSAPTTPLAVEQDVPDPPVVAGGEASIPVSTSRADNADAQARPQNPFAARDEPVGMARAGRHRKAPASVPTGTESQGAQRAAGRTNPFLRRPAGGSTGRTPLGGKNVAALTVSAIATVAAVALIVASALWWFSRDAEVAAPPGQNLAATPGPVLSAGQMLNETMAKAIDPSRSWSQTLDQAGINDASPNAACLGPLTADQPIPQITQLRGLSASGDDRTAALHRADAYATAEEAQSVYEFRSAELGSCTDTSLYVQNGLDVTGIGDQSLGVRLVLQDDKPEYHSVLLVRTGRIVNVLDVARVGNAADMEAVVEALSPSVNRQCGPAVGLCTAPTTGVSTGLPPAGGEQRGFLTSGDIPRVSDGSGTWRGNPPATQVDIQDGSGCEAVDLASVGGTGVTRQQRTYLLRNDAAAPPQFGIDQVVLTMGSAEEADALVERVSGNIVSCDTRTLTSQMDTQAALVTPGEDGVEVEGNWFVVSNKVGSDQSQKYRVGIMSAGDKVVYLRSNPTDAFDFSDPAWIGVSLRAGERVTQSA